MGSRPPKYLRPYQTAERLYGPSFGATLWSNRDSQRIRFKVLAETFPPAGLRLLDAGCGTGDFLAYLEEVGQPPAQYVGIDALEPVVAAARRRTFATPAQFIAGDLVARPELFETGQPDVIVISGTLNTLEPDQFFAVLDRAYQAAGRCVLFNFLSTFHAEEFAGGGQDIRRMDPIRVFSHGLRLTREVIVRHDYYRGHDCTMAWFKLPPGRPEAPE